MSLHNALIHKLNGHRLVVVLLSSCLLHFVKQNRPIISLVYYLLCLHNLCNKIKITGRYTDFQSLLSL